MLTSQRVYDQFKSDIVSGALEPGRGLTEAFLTERFGASRTPIRESCARLQMEGLLDLAPNKGYSVTAISLRDIQELFQIRSLFEEFTVQRSCARRDPERLERLESLAKVHHVVGDRNSYMRYLEANYEFHLGIAELAGNQRILNLLKNVMNQLGRAGYASLAHEHDTTLAVQQHSEIVCALRANDPDAAKSAMQAHIEHSREAMLRAV